LLPLGGEHFEFLYQLTTDEVTGLRWRYHGAVPTREAFASQLWSGVLVQFIVTARKSQVPIGLVVAYNADQRDGHAYFAVLMSKEAERSGYGIAAAELFIHYLFNTWPFRKLYAEIPEYNLPVLGNRMGALLKEEGRLKGHFYCDGQWWDQITVAIYPEDFRTSTRVARVRAGAAILP
jgi:RimJ/RimL family protein N-acetyltransferase